MSLQNENSNALNVGRNLFITALFILGGYSGYWAGDLLIERIPGYKVLLGNVQSEILTHIAFALLGTLATYLLASKAFNKFADAGERLRAMPANEKVAISIGLIIGLLLTLMLSQILHFNLGVAVLIGILLVYWSVVATTSMKDDLRLVLPGSAAGEETQPERCKILDTNVIIDGRVADICRTGFIEGPIYVPGFVLDELQHIADSSDSLKRARGRRGLDILNQMRTELKMLVRTYDNTDPNDHDEVDAKLVKLAKSLNGMIVTNDFNLNKVAELQDVQVLNINELANALKPVVLPGEDMRVTIIKEGKESNQGVAYLDDGTMIVVENARRYIGETIAVVTSSVLQTVAGKMIFASMRSSEEEEEDAGDRGVRAYPRSGPRRKI